MTIRCLFIVTLVLVFSFATSQANERVPLIYSSSSHRDLSLPALLLAYLESPDFIELPVVLTSDNELLVYNARILQPNTNVAEIFPQRQHDDGNFYVIDFTLAEVEQLSYIDRSIDTPVYDIPGHPASLGKALHVLTKASAIAGTPLHPIPVIKYPWFHRHENRDISTTLLDKLPERFLGANTTLYLKCFDPDELKRIANTLQKDFSGEMKLIQGIDHQDGGETKRWIRGEWVSYNDDWLFTQIGLRVAAGYADALSLTDIHRLDPPRLHRFIKQSHALNLSVFLTIPKDTISNTTTTSRTAMDRTDATPPAHQPSVFELGADGFIHGEIKKLRSYLPTQQQSSTTFPPQKLQPEQPAPPEQVPMTETENDNQDNASALLSDPEKLRERLKDMR